MLQCKTQNFQQTGAKMKVFGYEFTRKKRQHNNLDDDKRELALETRRRNSEIRAMQQELEKERLQLEHQIAMDKLQLQSLEIRDRIMDYSDEEEEEPVTNDMNPETMLLSILMNRMAPMTPTSHSTQTGEGGAPSTNSELTPQEQAPPSLLTLSDEEIKQVIDGQFSKRERKQLMSLPFKQLLVLAKRHPLFSTWSEETLKRATELYA